MAGRPNVLLVVVDACRIDYTSPYPGGEDRTPALASLADEGTVFRRAVSPAPWTLPSVTSLLTGDYPHEHGASSRGFAAEGATLVDELSAAGYRCVHVSPTTWLGQWLPQGRGFDEVVEFTGPTHRYFEEGADVRRLSEGVARGPEWYATVLRRAMASGSPLKSLGNAAAFKLTEAIGDAWLDDVRASETAAEAVDGQLAAAAGDDRPLFVYVHLMDPHLPLYVPAEFRSDVRPPGCDTWREEREYMQSLMGDIWAVRTGQRELGPAERSYLRARYGDEVAYADSCVGRMLDALADRGLAEETFVAVTADHGEHLGEREDGRTLLDHQASVRLPVVRVPLVVRHPDVEPGHRDGLVQTHYLAETVRAMAGHDYDHSRSLLADDAAARQETALAEYDGVVASHPPEEYATDRLFARRTTAVAGEWKLDTVAGERRAAHIDWQENEASEVDPEAVPAAVFDDLESTLAAAGAATGMATGDDRRAMPEGVEERLAELGYL